jgi:DNA-binding response OmpR family regulator
MTSICPYCGYNLVADDVLEIDGFRLDPRGVAHWQGKQIEMHPWHALILHSLAKAGGRPLSDTVLLERLGSEATRHSVHVYVSRLKRELTDAGVPFLIRRVLRIGFQWVSPI